MLNFIYTSVVFDTPIHAVFIVFAANIFVIFILINSNLLILVFKDFFFRPIEFAESK